MIVFKELKSFIEAEIKIEKNLEDDVVNNSKLFFGKDSIYIDAKKKLDSKSLGGCIPDGFLFDLSDKINPAFYIVEVELAKHDFYGHIFPQFTKFFGFFKISNNKGDLVDKLFGIINNDENLKKDFKRYLQEKEIYKFIKDLIDNSQNILLVIDGEKSELPDVMNTYNDTWGKFVKIIVLKKFISGNEVLFTMDPEFENIDYSYVAKAIDEKHEVNISFNENYHLENVSNEIKETYFSIKSIVNEIFPDARFNSRKYYIAISLGKNQSIFQFSKNKIRLVVMKDEEYVKTKIKNHTIKHLTESVQQFWNGNCCEIELLNTENISEVVEIIKELLTTAST